MLDKFSRLISEAPEGRGFYTDFGEIKSLNELKTHLSEKGRDFYSAYADGSRNHFANWVENIFLDRELAEELRNADTHEKAVKALDDKIKYAELWLNYNSKKEILIHYLTNGEFSIKQVMDIPEFSPEHHKYENSFDMDTRSITKITPPKTTFIQNFASVFQRKQPEDVPETEVMKNAVILPNAAKVRHKEMIDAEKERAAFSYLERIFPGVSSTAPVEKKSFFEKVSSWFWK